MLFAKLTTVVSKASEQEMDWINLPSACNVQSLWVCLHDGEIVSSTSDLIGQSVALECKVGYLLPQEEENTSFILRLDKVRSARANVLFRWPGEFSLPKDMPREEQGHLIAEYQAKWREGSLGWREFEAALQTDPLQISNADLAQIDGSLAIKVEGFLDGDKFDDIYCTVFLRGDSISASRSDGQAFSIQDFLALGRKYWEAFGKRRVEDDGSTSTGSGVAA